ncbi:MAG TPA: asparagine synthase (glutamine-hydrolyzing), partial [Phycisphaerales bacterium]|nr:asparagine synthase (glutamine-hydrolyzing) [Phycisphaerales bacterium]
CSATPSPPCVTSAVTNWPTACPAALVASQPPSGNGRGRVVTAEAWERGEKMHGGRVAGAIVYNGELYNDHELREELRARGVEFASGSDTETVAAALGAWGERGVDRLRGMYAIAWVDLDRGRMLLARDPLGIKPLYFAKVRAGDRDVVYAGSEVRSVLAGGGVDARPDPVVVSSYLTTIRTTLGERTLYRGISTLEPGQRLVWVAEEDRLVRGGWSSWDDAAGSTGTGRAMDVDGIRATVVESVRRHLRSDVPVCCLLSGGLDSSIIARCAHDLSEGFRGREMTTFCAGADAGAGGSDDFAFAARMAREVGSTHIEARVTREMFKERWASMVARMGLPLSTPNEVAINEVARTLRSMGYTVALSGEGADELFGGYDVIMSMCGRMVREDPAGWRGKGGGFHVDVAAWVPVEAKGTVLKGDVHTAGEHDAVLVGEYERIFGECTRGVGDAEGLQAHLRFQRRVNLGGLLLRLDQATMLESVEGRTPFADSVVASAAEGLGMGMKFEEGPGGLHRTKIALREAFAGVLPAEIATRPKASFPLPFQGWVGDMVGVLRDSSFAREWFTEEAVATVCTYPERAWKFAWPMVNLGVWAGR